MPRSIKSIEISPEDITHIFGHILETIMVYEYPTPSIFSALTRLSIVSYLRGKGIDKDIELVAVDIFRQLSEVAQRNSDYRWFVDWSKKLVGSLKVRKVEEV
tara:strand:+ start:1529 stop:1834 length:306 start_codon:yes stop_codon:yes gene_type:complete